MFSQIGQCVCNKVFNPSFCNQSYGIAAGWAILTGTAIIGFAIQQRLHWPWNTPPRPLSSRVVSSSAEPADQPSQWQIFCETMQKAGHTFSDSNKLPWNEKYLGFTGYIDGIFSSELTKPFMWGEDPHGRRFLCFRVLWWPKNTPEDKRVETLVVFERYKDSHSLTKSSRHFDPTLWAYSSTRPAQIDPQFAQFLQGETVEFSRRDAVSSSGKIISTTYCCQIERERDDPARSTDFRLEPRTTSTNPEETVSVPDPRNLEQHLHPEIFTPRPPMQTRPHP